MTTATKPVDESQALVKILNEAMPDLKRLAPKYVNLSRLMALALEARIKNPLLAKCNIASVVAFCKKAAEWGTDRVGAGGVWPVPFWNKKTNSYDMTPIPDWRLLVEKAKKAKVITHATADVVREGDKFQYNRGMTPNVLHEPALAATGKVIAAYCIYTLPDGTRDFVVMSASELDKVRRSSKAKDDGPWVEWPEEMDKKTVIKRAMKLFEGASVELTIILEADHRAMGFADYTETPEPITMPKAIAAPETREEEQSSERKEPATPPPPPPNPEGSLGSGLNPLESAIAHLQTIEAIPHLSNYWNANAKERESWTKEEQTRFKMAFDARMTEIKGLAKEGKLL